MPSSAALLCMMADQDNTTDAACATQQTKAQRYADQPGQRRAAAPCIQEEQGEVDRKPRAAGDDGEDDVEKVRELLGRVALPSGRRQDGDAAAQNDGPLGSPKPPAATRPPPLGTRTLTHDAPPDQVRINVPCEMAVWTGDGNGRCSQWGWRRRQVGRGLDMIVHRIRHRRGERSSIRLILNRRDCRGRRDFRRRLGGCGRHDDALAAFRTLDSGRVLRREPFLWHRRNWHWTAIGMLHPGLNNTSGNRGKDPQPVAPKVRIGDWRGQGSRRQSPYADCVLVAGTCLIPRIGRRARRPGRL